MNGRSSRHREARRAVAIHESSFNANTWIASLRNDGENG
jgi:hypothetical protein